MNEGKLVGVRVGTVEGIAVGIIDGLGVGIAVGIAVGGGTAILRTRWLLLSAKYMLPVESSLIPHGPFNVADVAAPLSPEKPAVPVPAIVVMMPVDTVTTRMRLLPMSEMYKLPREAA